MARIGLHPRLARALLDGAPRTGTRRAADIVALLSEQPPRERGDDLAAAWRTTRRAHDAHADRWRREARRLAAAAPDHPATALTDDTAAGLLTALAFPERVARRRAGTGSGSGTGTGYLMASGTAADLADGTRLGTPSGSPSPSPTAPPAPPPPAYASPPSSTRTPPAPPPRPCSPGPTRSPGPTATSPPTTPPASARSPSPPGP